MFKHACNRIAVLALAALPLAAVASGYQSPAHSQLAYSFTCPGGGSGHASYQRKGAPTVGGTLSLWVNGSDLHALPALDALKSTHNLESISAACEAGTVVVFLAFWNFAASRTEDLAIHVDANGRAEASGPPQPRAVHPSQEENTP